MVQHLGEVAVTLADVILFCFENGMQTVQRAVQLAVAVSVLRVAERRFPTAERIGHEVYLIDNLSLGDSLCDYDREQYGGDDSRSEDCCEQSVTGHGKQHCLR